MSEKKNTKEFLIGNDHIFDNSHLDERQKAEAYKITFKLFIVMFYTVLFMSFFAFAFAIAATNTALLFAGAAGMIIAELFIVLYAAMASSKGVMNLEFARKTSNPLYAVSSIMLAVVMFLISADRIGQGLNIKSISVVLYVLIYTIANLLMFYYSRQNMKILEKQLKDDEENNE